MGWEEVVTTVKTLLTIFGGLAVVAGGLAVISNLFSPIKELKEKVKAHDQMLDNDKKSIKELEEYNKIACMSLLALINHEITGNSIENLKKQRSAIEQFLINR